LRAAFSKMSGHGHEVTADMIFNLDECGFLPSENSRVFVRKGSKHTYTCDATDRDSPTVLLCICANGTAMPPCCIVKGALHRRPTWWGEIA